MQVELGLERLQDGEFASAIKLFTQALAEDATAEVYYYRGVAYDLNGQRELACADLSACLDMEPGHSRALFSRATVLREMSDFESSFRDIQLAYKVDSQDFRIANAYAQFLVDSPVETHRDPELGVKVATQACELTEWQDGLCLRTLADALELTGESEKAAEVRARTVASFDFADIDDEIMGYLAFTLGRRPEAEGLQEIVPASEVRVSIRSIKARQPDQEAFIFSVGMSAKPMDTPQVNEDGFAEVVMRLPGDWPLPPDLDDPGQSWPLLWLRRLAHYPHLTGAWLGTGLFPEPGETLSPLAPDCKFSGFVLLANMGLEGFRSQAGHYINLITVVPITANEHELACRQGLQELLKRLVEAGHPPGLVRDRGCVATPA
ncbi:MAG: suppressor of fused domain protein [Candidatus Eremiobacteraeota bacterium]|nr:suppressor of fused domain protein [Candidatus Eremiobacteraeota bacterium]